ncbi:MAG: ATP-binding protein [Clostridia bacterium]|nr:ATP-binding protein [Clostridia bacterium]MBR4459525.1 ATP-binding protein [Clostridia bacterium]
MKELTLEARLDNIPRATAWIDEALEALDCPMKAQMQIDVALDEIFSNIARYAYAPGTGDATMRFDFDEGSGLAEVTFIDAGTPYNPLENDDPDVSLPAEERRIGGLGIFLVKKTMDELRYRHENGKNILSLFKKIR